MAELVPTELDQSIEAFRRFNRVYTRVIGLLDEELLKSGRSLSEARVLFELATGDQIGPSEIADKLNLDAGYLSRILAKFEKDGLLSRSRLPADGRHAVLRLTRKGKTAFGELDRRSASQARGILNALTPVKRSALIQSMGTIERVFAEEWRAGAPFILRSQRPGDMGWVVERHAVLYTEEYGWNDQFEGLVAKIVAEFISGFDARRERCWIAERDRERLGCVFLVQHPEQEDTAKLRLLLVEPSARGMGLGKALVGECVQSARLAGYKRMTLWTQSILHAAHRIYQQAGFRLTAEEPHHSFGKDLVGQTWELEL